MNRQTNKTKEENVKETIRLLDVYAISEQPERQARDRWTKIGIGFVNRDDSINVVLDALPINGRMHIRLREAKKTKEGE